MTVLHEERLMLIVDERIKPSILPLANFAELNFTHTAGRSAPSVVYTIKSNKHPSLVLRRSCLPEKVGVNKKMIFPIRNKGLANRRQSDKKELNRKRESAN
jgi:hypothetical protein